MIYFNDEQITCQAELRRVSPKKMIILPAIDLRNGNCVNLIQGRADNETIFSDHPVEMAERWEAKGAKYLHLVDLDGAFHGTSKNLQIVKEIVETIDIPVQLGGGIRTLEKLNEVLELGIARAILGTAALKNTDLVITACRSYNSQIAVGIDARDGLVATAGWLDVSEKPAIEFAREIADCGVQTIIYTDIRRDGMLMGPNVDATKAIIDTVEINVIASGGVTSLTDIKALKSIGASGAIIGRAIYTGDLELQSAIATVLD